MFFDGGFTFSNFLMDALAIFAFVVWFWLLVVIYSDATISPVGARRFG
jgi:hypothetical protein